MLNNVECSPAFSPANEVTLIGNNTGPDLTIKQLRAGDGISLDDSNGCIEITSIMSTVTLSPADCSPPGESLVVDGVGPDLTIRQISAGMGNKSKHFNGCLEIINDSPASSVTLSPADCSPPGESLVVDGIGPDLTIRQISAGMGISLSTLTGCLEIINDSPASSVTLSPADCSPPGESLVVDGIDQTDDQANLCWNGYKSKHLNRLFGDNQ